MSASHPRLLVLLGPTAGGKSDWAVSLAQRLGGGEILSADSMQVYRHLDAATAKPSPDLRALVPHHLIDLVEPTQRFTVADWMAQADDLIRNLLTAGRWPIVVGGTNLYLKVLLEGLFPGPPGDTTMRAELEQFTGLELHARLAAVDPPAAHRIHPNDRKKLIRALEVHTLTGKPISQWQTQWQAVDQLGATSAASDTSGSMGGPRYRHDPLLLGLTWPVEAINRRINQRVKLMFEGPEPGEQAANAPWPQERLPDEVRRLEAQGLLGPQAREALGYKQVLEHLQGRCSLEEAFERTKILTRHYAKTQRTWLKRFRGVHWLSATQTPTDAWATWATEMIQSQS